MALNDFDYIKRKIRLVTEKPSPNQLSNADLIDYINSFMIYDLPLHSKYFYHKTRFSLNLVPSVGVYSIENFKNQYNNFEPPAYVDNYQIQYFQDDQSFYQMFSQLKFSTNFSSGNGTAGPYNGTYSFTPIQRETAIISTVNAAGALMTATDNGNGTFVNELGAVIAGSTIDYETGTITNITFTAAVPIGGTIYISCNQYLRGRPISVLYFNNEFFFYPFPDRSYNFTIDAYINPAATVAGGGSAFPELNQWADVIAFGTAMKIFQDDLDMESYQKVMPFFEKAKNLSLRRTMKQLSNQRVGTIYGDSEIWPWQHGYPFM